MKKNWLKKLVKILLIVVASLVLLFLVLAAVISPIAHSYIEKHSKELCHRTVTMDDLTINLFTGTVTIEGFCALEENDTDKFLTFSKLRVNMNVWKLLAKVVKITEITLVEPDVIVLQNENHFNFSDIIDFYKSDEPKEDKPTTWIIDLCHITLQTGNVVYQDQKVGSCFKINDLGLAIPRIYFSSENTDVGLNLKFDEGGDLKVKMLYALESNSYHLNVQLNQFSIASIAPYVKNFLQIEDFDGILSTNLNVVGDLDHILDIVADGTVQLQNVYATHSKQSEQKFAEIGNLQVAINKVDVANNVFDFGEIALSDVNFIYDVTNDGNTLSGLLTSADNSAATDTVAPSSTETTTNKPIDFVVRKFSLRRANVTYTDFTMRDLVKIPVTQIATDLTDFRITNPISMKISAIVGESGQLNAQWQGSLADFSNQQISVLLKNFKLPTLSPYSVHYMAYPISDGVMSFADQTTIVNNQIVSNNRVDIYNCVVDKKIKGAEREFNIPLRAAVYVLADRKGQITFDLPVKGDISSPNFSYRKIIFKTLCNLIVKIAAAPIDLIMKNIGKDPDVFADITYPIHPQGLGSNSDDKLNKMAEVLKEKTELILEVQQSLNWEENEKEYALFSTKMAYCRQQGATNTDLYEKVAAVKTTDPNFVAYVNNQLADTVKKSDIKSNCLALYPKEEVSTAINANIERRNQQIISVFTTQGIAADRVKILPLGDKVPPKGNTLVSFNLQVKDE